MFLYPIVICFIEINPKVHQIGPNSSSILIGKFNDFYDSCNNINVEDDAIKKVVSRPNPYIPIQF